MGKKQFHGTVTTDLTEVRFAFSGTVSSVRKKFGDQVKKGEVIASLDRKFLQIELDRQLADYEKARASFELFKIKYGEGGDDTVKYLRQEVQASLNTSVKEVELAKFKMDQADLICPTNGVVIDTGGLVIGLNVTPASNPVKVVDRDVLRFEVTVDQEDLGQFTKPVAVSIHIPGMKKEYKGTTVVPSMGKNGQFNLVIMLEDSFDLTPGMKGTAKL